MPVLDGSCVDLGDPLTVSTYGESFTAKALDLIDDSLCLLYVVWKGKISIEDCGHKDKVGETHGDRGRTR